MDGNGSLLILGRFFTNLPLICQRNMEEEGNQLCGLLVFGWKNVTTMYGKQPSLQHNSSSILLLVSLMCLDLYLPDLLILRLSSVSLILQAKVLNVVDVSYGGENGFNLAIELSSEILANVKFIQEKRLIGKYFEEISQDTGKYVFGIDDTIKALEMGAVEILIVWENLDINRYILKNSSTGEIIIRYLNKEQDTDQSNFRDSASNAELEVQEKMSLLEWFANEYKGFGCTLEFVTNKSQEGSQFCRGFGGILRYQLDIRSFDELSDDGENYDTE